MFRKVLLLAGIVALASNVVAKADTIGPGSCASCLGSSYTLSYTTTSNPNVFDVTLVINATGYKNGSSDSLNSVSLKLSSSTPAASLISAPTGFNPTVSGGLNANGCSGSGSGFFCSESSGLGLQVGHAGDIYTFVWAVTVGSPGNLFTDDEQASVKALYVNTHGNSHGLTSEEITLDPGKTSTVPEPGSLVLLGTGVLGAAGAIKRRLSA
jgi:hypothetical protein